MINPLDLLSHVGGCVFHKLTGLYCPGCGGTRAVHSLLAGDIPGSIYFHPLVVYGVAALLFIIVGWTVRLVRNRTGRDSRPYRFPDWTLWGALIVIGVNFFIKNGALLFFGIDLL